MQLKFERLIKKHSKDYIFTTTGEGYFGGPTWVEGEETDITVNCAIFPFTEKKVARYDGLNYTTKDIKIFIPVSEAVNLAENDSLEYQGEEYELDRKMDRTTHSDFVKWFAKWVSNQ